MDNKNCCGSEKKSDKSQDNIKCAVKDCVYHSSKDLCEAAQIEVCPDFNQSSDIANCRTYKQK